MLRKKKKKLTMIIVKNSSASTYIPDVVQEFDIPAGGSYEIDRITGNFKIIDKTRNTVHQVFWPAGSMQEYEFFYD